MRGWGVEAARFAHRRMSCGRGECGQWLLERGGPDNSSRAAGEAAVAPVGSSLRARRIGVTTRRTFSESSWPWYKSGGGRGW
jgi:hypothetical protein